jgi:hypothetical protein
VFSDFDFSVLDSPAFKEDSVREEIVAPIIRRLGYRSSGSFRVQRSKGLVHPFVMIGSKRQAVNIIPDCCCETVGKEREAATIDMMPLRCNGINLARA